LLRVALIENSGGDSEISCLEVTPRKVGGDEKTKVFSLAHYLSLEYHYSHSFGRGVVSGLGYLAQQKVDNEQNQQIAELRQTTPTREITRMIAYRKSGHEPTIINVRNDPVLRQQVYNLSGVASDVPDNGAMFMVVHDYGLPTLGVDGPSNHYCVTPVTPLPTNNADQPWKDLGVYIGEKSAPETALTFRLTLYFCAASMQRKYRRLLAGRLF
jgi:hypothetical protein